MKTQHPHGTLVASAVALLAALVLVRLTSLPESDIFFSIYHGQSILQGSPILAPDSWNFQSAGELWLSNSWLWDVALAIAYNALGLIGVSLFNGACLATAIWLSWLLCKQLNVQSPWNFLLTAAFALAAQNFFTARAVSVDILLLLAYAYVVCLLRAKFAGRKLIASAALTSLMLAMLGMNLHLSAPIFALLFPAIALILIRDSSWVPRTLMASAIALSAALGVLLTPYGLAGITKAAAVADASRQFIVEWNSPDLSTALGWVILSLLVVMTIVAALLAWHRRFFSAGLMLLLNAAAFEAIRFTIYPLVLSLLLGAQLLAERKAGRQLSITRGNRRLILTFSILIAVVCAGFVAAAYASPSRLTQIEPHDYAAFAPTSRVISDPSQGSAILFYRRDVQVAVDGRNDLLGAKRYLNATNTFGYASVPKLRAWLEEHKVDGAFLTKKQNADLGERFLALGWKAHPGVYGVAYTR